MAAGCLIGAGAWAAALVWAPRALERPAPERTACVVATAVYVAAGAVCHQRADRSFHRGATQLPVCARCAGLYAGAPAGLLATLLAGRARRPSRCDAGFHHGLLRLLLAAAAAPVALTAAGELLGIVEPSNLVRAATGVPLGAAAAALVGLAAVAPSCPPRAQPRRPPAVPPRRASARDA